MVHEFETARFEHAGDVRRMLLVEEGEKIVVVEELSGPSALVAGFVYAFVMSPALATLRASFSPEALSALIARVGFTGADALWGYLADERHDIVDLMDLCDRHAITYEFRSDAQDGDGRSAPAETA